MNKYLVLMHVYQIIILVAIFIAVKRKLIKDSDITLQDSPSRCLHKFYTRYQNLIVLYLKRR